MATGSEPMEFVKLVGTTLQKRANPRKDNRYWFKKAQGPNVNPTVSASGPVFGPASNPAPAPNPASASGPVFGPVFGPASNPAPAPNPASASGPVFGPVFGPAPNPAPAATPNAGPNIPTAIHSGPTTGQRVTPNHPLARPNVHNLTAAQLLKILQGQTPGQGGAGAAGGAAPKPGFGWKGMAAAIALSALASHLFGRYMGTPSGEEFAETKRLIEALKAQLRSQQHMLETAPYHYANIHALANALAARQDTTEALANMLMQMAASRQQAPQTIFI